MQEVATVNVLDGVVKILFDDTSRRPIGNV